MPEEWRDVSFPSELVRRTRPAGVKKKLHCNCRRPEDGEEYCEGCRRWFHRADSGCPGFASVIYIRSCIAIAINGHTKAYCTGTMVDHMEGVSFVDLVV